MHDKTRKRIIAFAVLLVSIVSFVYVLVSAIAGVDESMQRFLAPGTATLELPQEGTYTIFQEYVGRSRFPDQLPPYAMTLKKMPGGTEVLLKKPETTTRFSEGDKRGFGILEFEIDTPGTYEFTMQYNDNRNEPKVSFAIGCGFVKNLFQAIIICFAILFSGILTFIYLLSRSM